MTYAVEKKVAAAAKLGKKANGKKGQAIPTKWPQARKPSLALNPIAASGPSPNFYNEWLNH